MKFKTILGIVIIAVVSVAAVIWYMASNNCSVPFISSFLPLPSPYASPSPSPGNNPEDYVQMSVKNISELDSFFNVKAEYPQFNSAGTEFNNNISSFVEDNLKNFKTDAKANWQARIDTASSTEVVPEAPPEPFDFIATWNPVQVNNKYISFFEDIFYFAGGAHGTDEIRTFNYDFAKNQEITINDFLNNSATALSNLSRLSIQEIKTQLESKGVQVDESLNQMIQSGAAPDPENYQNFTFNYNSLTIYFERYQVAPGAVGSIAITFYNQQLISNSIQTSYLQ